MIRERGVCAVGLAFVGASIQAAETKMDPVAKENCIKACNKCSDMPHAKKCAEACTKCEEACRTLAM